MKIKKGKGQMQKRQGDILVVSATSVPKLPEVPQEQGRVVLAYGEATGHHHSFAGSPKVRLFRADPEALVSYLQIDGVPASLQHQEHSEHVFTPGKYKVIQQRQWTLARVRRVVD